MAKRVKVAGLALYKVLSDGMSIHGGTLEWSLPTEGGPGDWHEVQGPLVRCANGLHLTSEPARRWGWGRNADKECYLVETDGEVLHESSWEDEYVARRVRLVRRLSWGELADLGIDVDVPAAPKKKARAPSRSTQPKVTAGPSPAMQFMRCAWEHRCGATPHSWQTVNSSMSAALSLAITSGMSFAKDDIDEMLRSMRGSYWFGCDGERFYTAACEAGNLQACQSYEAWAGRKPFMWEGKRLHVGRSIVWEGAHVTVTSFQDEKGALTACSYKAREPGSYANKIDRRFSITNDALVKAERDRKVETAILAESTTLHKILDDCDVRVAITTIVAWTPEQREAAAEWARLAWADQHKSRVSPPAPPPHLADAVKTTDDDERADTLRRLEAALRDARNDKRRAEEHIKACEERIAELRLTIAEAA